MVLVQNLWKLCTEVTYESNSIIFQEITLDLGLWNQGTSASHSLNDFYGHFADILSDAADYCIKDCFRKLSNNVYGLGLMVFLLNISIWSRFFKDG